MNSVKLTDIRKNLKTTKDIIINNINKLYEQSIKIGSITTQPSNDNNDNSNDNNSNDNVDNSNSIENIYMKLLTISNTKISSNFEDKSENINDDIVSNVNYMKTLKDKTNSITTVLNILNSSKTSLTTYDGCLNLDNYYIHGTSNEHSYLDSIILSIDSDYQKYRLLSKNSPSLDNDIIKRQRDISSEALPFITSNDNIKQYYSKNRIKFKEIPQKLFKNCNADVDDDLKLFLADFYKVNIVLVNMTTKKYRIINDYNNTGKTLIFIEYKYKYEPILSINSGITYLNMLEYIFKNIDKQTIIFKSIGSISKYRLSDLQTMAKELHISINYLKNNKFKTKLKKDLYFEIVNNIRDI